MRKGIKRIYQKFFVVSICLLMTFAVSAQNTITGRVTDSTGTGMPGVTVSVKGTRVATQTDNGGAFRIVAPAGATTLILTSIGYEQQQVAINGRNNISVSLLPSASRLTDVVVIGYGTRQKKDLTGDVTQVTSKDFQKGVITTPEQMIAGKVAGVSVISNSGQPGAGSTIRIRGGSSLNASNDPLIVIDGVPLENSSIAGVSNPLSLINSNDIESFTILKDASAAAIYGTRAANGVIIITTKKGRPGKFKVDFSSVNSVSHIINEVNVLSGDQIRSIAAANGTAAQKAMLGNANTDWQKQIYQTALASNNNISFSGGLKNLPYRVSIGFLNQDGILKTDNLQRTSLALVLNPTLFDNHLKIDINLKGSIEKDRFANQGAIGSAIYFDPTQPVYSGSKRFEGYFEWLNSAGNPNILAARNPVGQLNDRHDNSDVDRSIGNIQFDYKFPFFPDLHANLNLGYDVSRGTGTIFISDSSAIGFIDPATTSNYVGGGTNNHYKSTKTNTLAEFYLSYNKDISSIKSHVDALAGYSYNNYLTTNYAYASYYANNKMVPNSTPTFPYDKPENTLISVFGRANYSYNDKYLLTGTLRYDGSSKFAKANRWGLFPSAAFAWRIKNEDFLKNTAVVSDLKLRLGYGITGQQDGIGDYDYLSRYSLSNTSASYPFGNTFYQMYRPAGYDPNLKWEQTATTNLGLDYGFAKNRITGSIDLYYKKTTNLLNSIPQPAGTNFSAFVLANVGSMSNKGVEFSINLQPIKRSDLTWDVSFNATYNKNTILNLTVIPDDPNYIGFQSTNISGVQGFAFLNAVGGPKNTFYLYHQIYNPNGTPIEGLFEDVNRDGIINESDKYKGKSADPDFFLGFSTNFTYKKWNAGFVLRASFDNYVYNNIYSNNGRLNQILGAQTTGNASANYLTTLFKGNTDQQLLSDYYVQNASFLKMDNLYVGYNVGKIFHNKANLGLNFSVQNVFTITKYTGLDPEISNGVDNNLYPRPRIFALGLNLGL